MKKKTCARVAAMFIAVAMAATGILGCEKKNSGQSSDISNRNGTNVQYGAFALEVKFKEEDLNDSWEKANGTNIFLSDEEIKISGKGAAAEGSRVTISSAGTYVISGSLSDGQILVEAGKEDLVRLVFNGVDISCSDNAPVYITNADKTVLILAEGSENTVTDGTSAYTLNEDEEPNAAIFSKDDLTINGTGALMVTANYNNGIGCKDDLKLVNGQISVKAKNHGIKGNDSVAVRDGSYSVVTEGMGIKTTNETDNDKGYIYVEGGTFTIQSEDDGLHSNAMIAILGGTFTIASGDDALHSDRSLTITDGTIDVTSSYEGLESAEIYIEGGDIRIVASDDGINAAGGELETGESSSAGGNAPEGGNVPTGGNAPTGGNVPEEGMRPGDANMPEGDLPADGGNPRGGRGNGVTGGSIEAGEDFQAKGGGFRGNMGGGMMENSSGYLFISGGTIYVDADGDGLDSNADVEISGGYIEVNGPTNDGNGSLDYGNRFVVTGGTLIATGSSGMAVAPTEETTINTIFIGFNSAVAGSTLKILDSNGKEVLSTTPAKTYSSLVYSSDTLKSKETYTVTIDGETVDTFTMSDTVTRAGEISTMGGRGGGKAMDRGTAGDGSADSIPNGGMQGGSMGETPDGNRHKDIRTGGTENGVNK